MSKRHSNKKPPVLPNQPALKGTAPEGVSRTTSIAHLVLQRMSRLNTVETVNQGVSVPAATPPQIKVAPVPDDKGMPTVPSPADWPENWPPCPPHYNLYEWRKSLENKEYYELKCIEDDGKKPWFQYPRFPYQYSEFVYVTPEMAEDLLRHMPVNRPWKEPWSDAVGRDFKNERFLQTHESIAVNTLGDMQDGQHRAWGIKKAGRGWPIYITWNVPPESLYVIDSGDKRKINEKLGLLFPEARLTNKMSALCRAMMWGLDARGVRYSESEIAEFGIKHHDVLVWVATRLKKYRADLQAVVAKALLWWGEGVIGPFVARLATVQFLGDGDPAKTLYMWLMDKKHEGRRAAYANPTVYYRKALSAVYAVAGGRDATKLYQKQDDIFEWKAGWNVPDEFKGVKRPCHTPLLTEAEEPKPAPSKNGDEE